MRDKSASLDDKFDLSVSRVLLNGAQAAVRLTLMQHALDQRAGLRTAGYVTGYRGSPIAGLESQFARAAKETAAADVVFHAAINEDLAATALWGTQQAELRGEGKFDGVFGIWYGKGPGVDRSGDALRHANHAGTSKYGGVVALAGDDHTCESSTTAHQSEWALMDAMIPVFNPAGVQEILDFGLHGFALSRFAGVWTSIKCVKDNFESTSVVETGLDRASPVLPADFAMPPGGLNIRLNDHPLQREERLHRYKMDAVVAYARANRLDKRMISGGRAPRIGIVSTGKSYLDTRAALAELGIDEVRANALGVALYKIGLVFPFESRGFLEFARGLDLIVVVEEKRMIAELYVKEALHQLKAAPSIIGKRDENGDPLFQAYGALEPTGIAVALGERILRFADDSNLKERVAKLKAVLARPATDEIATRLPYFCPGCPHNSSTVVPAGSHAYAGIGCHYMAQWMDRATDGFTHMGAEGANWIGEASFSKRGHVFQNLGDGTYVHSGSMAIRAAIAAGVNITYKILYNDAVAMTGGQPLDGGKTVAQMANEVAAEGAKRVVIVTDEPDKYGATHAFPAGTTIHHRREIDTVQKELRDISGVTVLIYDQTCAAEKRRRRKRGTLPDPQKRVLINEAVCEGCGDCGKKSNCVAIVPVETALGRKRAIDQSACNKDYSCVEGFCPSFVTVEGGHLRKPPVRVPAAGGPSGLPEPARANLEEPYAILLAGAGGTGVITIAAILGEAAFLDGIGFGGIDMTGLAQKGGSVWCHLQFAENQETIQAIRVGPGMADLVLGCDLVVAGGNKALGTMGAGKTSVVLSTHETLPGEFTRQPELTLPTRRIFRAIEERVGAERLTKLDSQAIALREFGDTVAANMILLGVAFQLGLVPLTRQSILRSIELNRQSVAMNQAAFAYGQRLAVEPALAVIEPEAKPAPEGLDGLLAHRVQLLTEFQNADWAERFRARIVKIAEAERRLAPGKSGLAEMAARALAKLMAYKDEYEVARLYTSGEFAARLTQTFEGEPQVKVHLAPPLLARRDPATGHPRKMAFGAWIMPVFRMLSRLKGLRGTRFDPFGMTAERRLERRMITDYEGLLDEIEARLSPGTHALIVELAATPMAVKGFGHVKLANAGAAKARETELLRKLRAAEPPKGRQQAA